jgi:hypothetical protein
MTLGAGTTRKGTPYEMKFPTENHNVGIRYVDRPDVLSKYFQDSNCVDRHNQARQFELHLEKSWVTMDPWFRLHTTYVGINVTDCWKLGHFHSLFNNNKSNTYSNNKEETMPIRKFAGILSKQMLDFATQLKTLSFF